MKHSFLKQEPATVEWDFTQCPEDQLRWCEIYEYSRENTAVVQAVERMRVTLAWHPEDLAIFPGPSHAALAQTFFQLFREFPGTPFLHIPYDVRHDRCALLNQERLSIIVQIQPVDNDRP